jgi:hypothetical protein
MKYLNKYKLFENDKKNVKKVKELYSKDNRI